MRRDKEAHAARKASSEVPEAEDDAEAEEQCRKLLEESVERARGIEEEVADAGARARELEKGLAEEEDAIEALKMELRRVRAAGSMGAVRDSHAEQVSLWGWGVERHTIPVSISPQLKEMHSCLMPRPRHPAPF